MNALRAWLRERVPVSRFGPLALFIATLGGAPTLARTPMIGLAALLIVTFRLRDDLADRERDAIEHPDRVLPRAASLLPFALAIAIGLAIAFVHIHRTFGLTRALALLSLAATFELAYRVELPGRHRWVLLKYPLFALLLADRLAPTLAALCYASFAIYERLDDPTLRERPDADQRLAAYLFAAALLGGLHLYSANASFAWLLTFGALWAFAVEAVRGRSPGARHGLFLVCLLLWAHDQFAMSRGASP